MPGRSRKADTALSAHEPAAKKAKTTTSAPSKSLKTAVFGNGKQAAAPRKLEARLTENVKGKTSLTEGGQKTKVGTAVGLTRGEEVESEEEEEGSDEEEEESEGEDEELRDAEQTNGQDPTTTSTADASRIKPADDAMDVDDAEPTFGDLLRSGPIDVSAALAASDSAGASAPSAGAVAPNATIPSAASLSTVLQQALRTNDKILLESCFALNDLDAVRATVARLPSDLVGSLLLALAERLHSRPGRANNLMVWVQWSLVSHGGYLATRRDVVDKLASLQRVMRERANGLQPLLALKGRLDMLSAQLELRREQMERGRRYEDEIDEGAVIYVEGEEDEENEDGKPLNGGGADDLDLDDATIAALANVDEEDDSEAGSDEGDDESASDDGFSEQEEDEEESSGDEELDDSEDEDDEQPARESPVLRKGRASAK